MKQIPFISQSASLELAEKIFSGGDPKIDKNWKLSGAETIEEYSLWVKNICGMACLAMILKAKGMEDFLLILLAKEAIKFGVYIKNPNGEIDGMFYEPFVKFIKEKFGFNGEVIRENLNIAEVRKRLNQEQFIIASVSPKIRYAKRDKNLKPETKGGHLILIIGIDEENIYYHDPAGIYNESQENASLELKRFDSFFVGRGVAIIL